MTALTAHTLTTNRAHHAPISATSFDRMLLRAASALDGVVAARLQRRASTPSNAAATAHDSARAHAQALGAIGILPR